MSRRASLIALVSLAAAVVTATGCDQAEVTEPESTSNGLVQSAEPPSQQVSQAQLPFRSDIDWGFRQIPVPPGQCADPLPAGLDYLWLTELWGTAVTTHLGEGDFSGTLCIYGLLTNPGAEPPGNGTPVSYRGSMTFTAANGDELHATVRLVGFKTPPEVPELVFVEEAEFVDGGTGRFRYVEGIATGLVDPVGLTADYEGWIRFGSRSR